MASVVCNTRALASPVTGPQRYIGEILARLGSNVESISPRQPFTGALGHAWEQIVLPRLVKDRLLWSPSNTGPLAISFQVVTIHDLSPLDDPRWHGRRFGAWYRWLLPRLTHTARRLITPSLFTRERLVERLQVPPDKIAVIPLGVDKRFRPRPSEEVERVVRNLALPSRTYVLVVGSLEPRKNLRRLLLSWDLAHRSLPGDLWLVVTGGRGSKGVFRSQDLHSVPPRVHLTGYVADHHLPALYSGATAFVYPSLYEGFGLPILEAMAAGTPVLTSNRTSLPEVVGDSGLLVDPENVDDLAASLRGLIEDAGLREGLREKGLRRAAAFTWERAAAETWNVLEESASE